MIKRSDVIATKRRLEDYREIDRDIENQIERLDRMTLRMEAAGAQSISDMPKTPGVNTDRMASFVAEKEELENSIRDAMNTKISERTAIEECLSSLHSSDEKAVIRIRYIDNLSWDDVSAIIFGGNVDFLEKEESYMRRIHRIHASALRNMADAGFH